MHQGELPLGNVLKMTKGDAQVMRREKELEVQRTGMAGIFDISAVTDLEGIEAEVKHELRVSLSAMNYEDALFESEALTRIFMRHGLVLEYRKSCEGVLVKKNLETPAFGSQKEAGEEKKDKEFVAEMQLINNAQEDSDDEGDMDPVEKTRLEWATYYSNLRLGQKNREE